MSDNHEGEAFEYRFQPHQTGGRPYIRFEISNGERIWFSVVQFSDLNLLLDERFYVEKKERLIRAVEKKFRAEWDKPEDEPKA